MDQYDLERLSKDELIRLGDDLHNLTETLHAVFGGAADAFPNMLLMQRIMCWIEDELAWRESLNPPQDMLPGFEDGVK